LQAEHLGPLGLRVADYLGPRDVQALLPWDHLDVGVTKKHLLRERQRAFLGLATTDCAVTGRCHACGACDRADPYRLRDAAKTLVPRVQTEPPARKPATAETSEPNDATPAARPQNVTPPRLRLRLRKIGPAVFVSHLDLQQHVLRAVRLSGLPVLYSSGFTPRPRVGFSPALPTGISSEGEYIEASLAEPIDAALWAERLAKRLPRGIEIMGAEVVAPQTPSVNDAIVAMRYRATRPEAVPADAWQQAATALWQRATLPVKVQRKGKPRFLDARAFVTELSASERDVVLSLKTPQGVGLKIREALAAMLAGIMPVDQGLARLDDVLLHKLDVVLADAPAEAAAELATPSYDALDLTQLGADRN
jgi:radical SAM-linked protein